MQHSVAAVETLYLIDELDTIPYRTALETAILSEIFCSNLHFPFV